MIQVRIWVVSPIIGNIQYRMPTIMAPIPNQRAAKAGRSNSERIRSIPNTNQCQGSRTNSIS